MQNDKFSFNYEFRGWYIACILVIASSTFFIVFHVLKMPCSKLLIYLWTSVSRNVTRALSEAPLTMSGKPVPIIDPKDVPEGYRPRHKVNSKNIFHQRWQPFSLSADLSNVFHLCSSQEKREMWLFQNWLILWNGYWILRPMCINSKNLL